MPNDMKSSRNMDRGSLLPLPPWLSLVGVVAGFAIAFAGPPLLMSHQPTVSTAAPDLILCVGLAILLAMFGAGAHGTFNKINLGGAAAISMALFAALRFDGIESPWAEHQKEQPTCAAVYHSLRYSSGKFPPKSQIAIADLDGAVLGSLSPDGLVYHFVLPDRRFKSSKPRISVADSPDSAAITVVFDSAPLNAYIEAGDALDLEYNPESPPGPGVFDIKTGKPVGLLGGFASASTTGFRFPSLVREAHAAERNAPELIDSLGSGDLQRDVQTTTAIIQLGSSAVNDIIQQLFEKEQPSAQGAILAALLELIQRDEPTRTAIATKLDPEALGKLVTMQSNEDRGVRLLATQVLIALGDPESVPLLESAARSGDRLGRLNAVIALEEMLASLTTDRADAIVASVRAMASTEEDPAIRTRKMEFDQPVYYLVVASFADPDRAIQRANELTNNGFPDAQAYSLANSRYHVVTLSRARLRDMKKLQRRAVNSGVAGADAWSLRLQGLTTRLFPA